MSAAPTDAIVPVIYDGRGNVVPITEARRNRAMEALRGAWTGARSDVRSLRNWFRDPGSADGTSIHDLPELRAGSRDLVRNGGLASSLIESNTTYIAGDSIRVQPAPDVETLAMAGVQLTEEAARDWAKAARRIWEYHEPHLDVERKHHGAELDDLVVRSVLESGDCLVVRRFIERGESRYGTRVQIVEADRLSTPIELGTSLISPLGTTTPEALPVLDGVERDLSTGAPTGYYVSNTHPGDGLLNSLPRQWTRVAAWDEDLGQKLALHPFFVKRPSQTRGWPILAPVIEELKQLQQYVDAELMAAVIASYFTVFIKSTGAQGFANMAGVSGTSTEHSRTLADEVALGRGAVVGLGPNEDIEVADPKRPNEDANGFVEGMSRVLCAATGMPAEVVLKTFTASYSASRGAILEAWRTVKARRGWFYRAYKDPVYQWTITEAVARGDLDAPGFFADPMVQQAWLRAKWIGDPQGQIDPAKESNAAKTRQELGIGTKTQRTIELTGGDFEADARRRAEEDELEKSLGLVEEPESPGFVNAMNAASEGGGNGDGD